MKRLTVWATVALTASAAYGQTNESAREESHSVFDLSLEQLMAITVDAGNLTGIEARRAPVPLTVITREDIAVTPARNLADLIEIYVPGATWFNHLGPRIAMRGLVGDRNYKFLLRVNGVVLNQTAAQGVTQEIQNWDLNDIERVEIIRGPGSVTYGPGAVAGVIDITTRTGRTAPGMEFGVEYNAAYDSKGGYASMGYHGRDLDAYVYASARWTEGDEDASVFDINPATGQSRFIDKSTGGNPYLEDVLDDPQVKAHLDLTWYDEWRMWARFTRAGWPDLVTSRTRTVSEGRQVPTRFTVPEAYVIAVENVHPFSDAFLLETRLAYRREHYSDYFVVVPEKAFDRDPYQGVPSGNVVYDFVEEGFSGSVLGRWEPAERIKLAAGYEQLYDRYRRDSEQDQMYLNLKSFQTRDGRSLQDLMGGGFDSRTHSLLAEVNLDIHRLCNLVLSGRVDDNDQAKTMVSPRVAMVSSLSERDVLKLIWQRSVRMSTAEEIHKENLDDRKGDPETLTGYEVQYARHLSERASVQVSAFYNRIDVIGWGGQETISLGVLDLGGAELETAYRGRGWTLGANHSFVKQLDWDSGVGVTRQGISAADYGFNGLSDTGNDLNNWANHVSKLYVNVRLPKDLTLHADMQVFWGFEGYRDYRDMYERKYRAEGGDATWDALARRLEDEDFAGREVRLNTELIWRAPWAPDLTLSLYAMNLLDARRYVYSSGDVTDYPQRLAWVEEPLAVGVKAAMRF